MLSIPNGQPMPASVRLSVLPSSGSVLAPRRESRSFASLAATPKISFGLVLSVNKLHLNPLALALDSFFVSAEKHLIRGAKRAQIQHELTS